MSDTPVTLTRLECLQLLGIGGMHVQSKVASTGMPWGGEIAVFIPGRLSIPFARDTSMQIKDGIFLVGAHEKKELSYSLVFPVTAANEIGAFENLFTQRDIDFSTGDVLLKKIDRAVMAVRTMETAKLLGLEDKITQAIRDVQPPDASRALPGTKPGAATKG
jgi:hypothetical protein